MTRLEIESLIEEKYGVTGEKPWMKYPSFSVFRHEGNKKWFAVIMTLDRGKFGIDGDGEVDVVNLKCDTDIAYFVRQESGVYPAYHMNKEHWISVILDENTNREFTEKLLDMSVNLTATVIKKAKEQSAKTSV